MKKTYLSPEAEVLAFAKEDVITASGDSIFDWHLPTIDLGTDGGDISWSEDNEVLKM
jgi:hypothetical protein